jgi:hypothetical protein
MLQTALDWMVQTKPGSTEIWIGSDLQESNWDSKSDRWAGLAAGFSALPQRVRTRLLALNNEPPLNHSIAVVDAARRQTGSRTELELVMDIERSSGSAATLPLTINLDGVATQVELRMDGPTLRYRHKVSVDNKPLGGWGYVELPADANLRDNRSYFVYAGPATMRAAVVATDPLVARLLQVATAPDPKNTNHVCEILGANAFDTANLENYSMILWQAPLPQGATASRLRAFAESGGVLVFFPPGDAGQFGDLGWGEVQNATPEKPFRVTRWEERDGPLAKTEEGLSLPIAELSIARRQAISGAAAALASFDDGAAFLARQAIGKGQILFCATQPSRDWSQLDEGVVLVPMLQRLLDMGGRRFAAPVSVECGEWEPDENDRWTSVDSSEPKNILFQSGVYRAGGKLVAVNRPARENDREMVDPAKAKTLLGSVPIYLFDEKQSGSARVQAELWRLFLIVMALCLVIEGILILPEKLDRKIEITPPAPEVPTERRPAEVAV